MKTGMKAPDGMGMVVATADIQNCKTRERETLFRQISKHAFLPVTSRGSTPLVVTKKTDCM